VPAQVVTQREGRACCPRRDRSASLASWTVVSRKAFGCGAFAGTVALALAGCGSDGDPAQDDAPTATDPLVALREASVKTMSTSFRIRLDLGQVRATGQVDPLGQSLTLDVSGRDAAGSPATQSVRVAGANAYQTLGAIHVRGIAPSQYIQFVAPSNAFTAASMIHQVDPFDPAALKGVAFAFVQARRDGDRFQGTIDLTKAASSGGLLPQNPQPKGAPEAVRRVGFDASVTDGYLTRLALRMPAIGGTPAFTGVSSFSDFNVHVSVQLPESAQIAEDNEDLREILTQ
jgi:hypothetical protein